MILVIDNFDSFTYNLVQAIEELGEQAVVLRNDALDLPGVEALAPSGIVFSPGPGSPASAGITVVVIRRFYESIPMLGVCLGHQCIGVAFGGRVVQAARVMHGKRSIVTHDGQGLFQGIPQHLQAVRYHALALDALTLPEELLVCARSEDSEVMALRHRRFPLFGVQFHPESIATEHGLAIMSNFLNITKEVV